MKGVILDWATLGPGVDISPLTDIDLEWTVYDMTSPEEVAERIQDAAVVLSNKVVITREHMATFPALRYIGVMATGMNNVDLEAAGQWGIKVTNVTGYGTASVAQHAFALILSLATSQPHYARASRDGTWSASPMFCLLDYPIMELQGRKLLIIGYGELGQAVFRLAEAFGMEVLIAAIPGSPTCARDRMALDEGLAQADVVSLHCPLTEQTRHLIDSRRLSLMQPHALLINTARGGLVDEDALSEALKQGRLGGAGFDVLSEEPPVNGNVLLDSNIPNLIVTPHCAWASKSARQKLVNMAADNVIAFLTR
ncbi:D-2-hydroxyacid dehydrogenase [Kistimonas asteriae]|uniref:D-2-hydroxyacid dehydrogenase n=1 Tax=Kistimonas asteriae TaxID=517724 RepID=UPI001BABAD95|nr:D-2-hydroxyacid dehydrogenase [Kistimonas asteriae]